MVPYTTAKVFAPGDKSSFVIFVSTKVILDFLPNFVLYGMKQQPAIYSREVLISQMDDLAHNLLTKSIPQRLLRRLIPEQKREKSSIKREQKRAQQ
jgi:hypothetical protein